MTDENSVNAFILFRAQGLTLDEISSRTGISRAVLVDWEGRYKPDVERVKDSVLDKVAAFVFDDLKKQLERQDKYVAKIEPDVEKLFFHPAHAEKAYSALAQLQTARAKMIGETIKFLTDYSKRRNPPAEVAKPVRPPDPQGGNDGIL